MKEQYKPKHIKGDTFSIFVDTSISLYTQVGFYKPDSSHAAASILILEEDVEIINLSLEHLGKGQAVSWYIQDIAFTAIPKDGSVNLTIKSKIPLFQQDLTLDQYREFVRLINENKQK